jgi:hypothetical protein
MILLAICVLLYGCGTQQPLNNIPKTLVQDSQGSNAGRESPPSEPAGRQPATRPKVEPEFSPQELSRQPKFFRKGISSGDYPSSDKFKSNYDFKSSNDFKSNLDYMSSDKYISNVYKHKN